MRARTIIFTVCCVVFQSPLARAAVLYGSSNDGVRSKIFTIDQATGVGTFVCDLAGTTTEIEYDDISGKAFSQRPSGLVQGAFFDLGTCVAEPPVSDGVATFNGLEYIGTTLYGTASEVGGPAELRILNPVTGASTLVGTTGSPGPIAGLAYDVANAKLYGIAGGPGPALLYRIDIGTGVATAVGSTGMQAGSLEFGDNGRLFAGGTGPNAGQLWVINPANGHGTRIGATGFPNVTGLTLRPPTRPSFTCYKVKATLGSTKFPGIANPPGVTLDDQFGQSIVAVKKTTQLCNPTQKDADPPPSNPDEHLEVYQVKPAQKFLRVLDKTVTDRFGVHHLDVVSPAELMVPTAKDLGQPPPPLVNPVTDHFQCYKVRALPPLFQPVNVSLVDQLGSLQVQVRKPVRLCAPVNQSNEDPTASTHPSHLLCYQVKDMNLPKFTPVVSAFVNNPLGAATLDMRSPADLCVPAATN